MNALKKREQQNVSLLISRDMLPLTRIFFFFFFTFMLFASVKCVQTSLNKTQAKEEDRGCDHKSKAKS